MVRYGLIFGLVALTACATTSKRKVVNIAEPEALATENVRYDTLEAAAACDTRKMRARALDDDPMNDIASITVVREISPGRRTETDLDLNCRDFFARRLGTATQTQPMPQPSLITANADTTAQTPVAPAQITPTYNTYRVRRGDTLYGIARAHCTGWKTLATFNNLPNAAEISPGQILRLPESAC